MTLKPTKHTPEDAALGEILALVHEAFAYMDGRIDPPSSMHRLTVEDIARQCVNGSLNFPKRGRLKFPSLVYRLSAGFMTSYSLFVFWRSAPALWRRWRSDPCV